MDVESRFNNQDGSEDIELLFNQLSDTESLFEFDDSLPQIPISHTLHRSETELEKSITIWNGLGLIIGAIIGSGIFASPGPIVEYSGSVGGALCVWLVAGFLSMCGGLCYAELGTMIPSSGGEHPYLKRIYGALPAFLFSWTGILAGRPGGIAIITHTCAEYITRLLESSTDGQQSALYTKLIAIFIICIITLINCVSTNASTRVQDFMTTLKIGSLGYIAAMGAFYLYRGSPTDNFKTTLFQDSSSYPGNYALALFSALWAYDGWNNLNVVTGELKDPSKNLPRAVIGGTILVTICYFTTNIAYFAVLDKGVVAKSTTIGMDFGMAVFGNVGSSIIPLIVIISTLGAANATVFTGARVTFITSQQGHAPKFFSRISSSRTPVNALILQAALSMVYILSGDYKVLVNLYSFIGWTFYFLCVFGILILRMAEPYAERPFKVWLAFPLLFSLVSGALIACSVWEAPTQALYALFLMSSGIPVYYVGYRFDLTWEDIVLFFSSLSSLSRAKESISSLLSRGAYQRQNDMDANLELQTLT
ncbi:hypothetical protein HDV01_006637 [Terramyces sp. JEL0728]|nr:hypothetical protein HDV01_006637 [Terramyces sp. JEL0728]